MSGLSERITEARRTAGLTQTGLASAAGVSVGFVRDLEQGRRREIRGRNLVKLASALRVGVAHLAGAEEHPVGVEIPVLGAVGAGPGRSDHGEFDDVLRKSEAKRT